MTDHFARLWALGYHALVPIIPPGAPISERSSLYKRIQAGSDDRGKVPGIRRPDGEWSSFNWIDYQADEQDLIRWQAMGAGVGIKAGLDGVVLIDADTLNKEHAYAIKEVIDRIIGQCPLRVGRSPKAGYVLRVSEPIPYLRIEFDDGDGNTARVEVLSTGRQFVAEGIHPGTGQPYRWHVPLCAHEALPVVSPEQIRELLEALRAVLPAATAIKREGMKDHKAVSPEALRGPPELVEKALKQIKNTMDVSREDYINVGYAVRGALGAEGFGLFADWAATWEGENKPAIVEADWARMREPRIGIGWLCDKAGIGAEKWFQPISNDENGLFTVKNDPKPLKEPGTLTFYYSDELTALPEPVCFVQGLLFMDQLSTIIARWGMGKTFFALDLACRVAMGWKWHNQNVKQGGVIYIALEGTGGIRKRFKAWCLKHTVDPDTVPIAFAGGKFDVRNGKTTREAIAQFAKKASVKWSAPIRWIVIDTLNRGMCGGNENAAEDMSAFREGMDDLRRATGANVCVIHHLGKDESKGARGSSSLPSDVDTETFITDAGDGIHVVKLTKQKEGRDGLAWAFKLEEIDFGTIDEWGEKITSCVATRCRMPTRISSKLGAAKAGIMEAFNELVGPTGKVSEDDLRTACVAGRKVSASDSEKGRRDTFNRYYRELVRENILTAVGGVIQISYVFDSIEENGVAAVAAVESPLRR